MNLTVNQMLHGSFFDYTRQAWLVDGKYVSCGHQEQPACRCYGSLHTGESPTFDQALEMLDVYGQL